MKFMLADTEVVYDKYSKKDHMLSVYVPFDCERQCSFCISKEIYSGGVNIDAVINNLNKIRESDVTEVIFTGGEPMNNLEMLRVLIGIVDNKTVYINTSFLEDKSDEFIKFVNETECIKGINISRHKQSLFQDSFNPEDKHSFSMTVVASDEKVKKITKPVRINVVADPTFTEENVKNIVGRWAKLGKSNIDVTFRERYQDVNTETLHKFDSELLKILTTLYDYHSSLYCHACDKIFFTGETFTGDTAGGLIRYHKGLQSTRITIGTIVEMQELVMYPNGELCTDWDGTKDGLDEFKLLLNIKE